MINMTREELMQALVEDMEARIGDYTKVLEGYGDMCRSLNDVQEDTKELCKACKLVQDYLTGDDPQGLCVVLQTVRIKAAQLCWDVASMQAKLGMFQRIVLPDGDLLALAEEDTHG